MVPVRLLFVALVVGGLALVGGGGCVTGSTVTEEDRKVVHYNREAWVLAGAAASTMGADPAAQLAAVSLVATKYGMPLSDRMVKSWGPPKEPPAPISEQTVKDAIDGSAKSHAIPWWQAALGGFVGALGFMLPLGARFARYLPGGAALWDLAAGTFGAIEALVAKKNESGTLSVGDLTHALEKAHSDPRLRPLADKVLFEVQKKLGIPSGAEPAVKS